MIGIKIERIQCKQYCRQNIRVGIKQIENAINIQRHLPPKLGAYKGVRSPPPTPC